MTYEHRGFGIELVTGSGFIVRRSGESLATFPNIERAKEWIDDQWETSKTLKDRNKKLNDIAVFCGKNF
jgi:hypothetical protein